MRVKTILFSIICFFFSPSLFSQSDAPDDPGLLFVPTVKQYNSAKLQHDNRAMHFHESPDLNGLRSDTINILHYTLNLSITDFTTDTLRGNTVIQFTPKMNNRNTISFDLLRFNIDSITINGNYPAYSYNDTLLIINLPSVMNVGDTSNLTIYYHGKPQLDPSGWGGFYFSGGYAFNLGVGFSVIPHNFGRSWYPCFDNFVQRAYYDFNITCGSANTSYCNGYLMGDTIDTVHRVHTRWWHMPYKIPSYEASVDVAPYVQYTDTYYGTDTLPIVVNCVAADTAGVRSSFVHLKNAISIFQTCYGKYRWNKVGYSLVSFTGGAMEHPTNIAYPALAANGTLDYEAELMAHELSHHWFGDLVTCSTAEDMWLNEGFANYNQFLFSEKMYGEAQYHSYVRQNHEEVLHYCAIADHGYWPISGMPQPYTYGNINYWVSTTYKKGADVIYTLRNYMGDSAFFKGVQYYLSSHMFEPVSADTLKRSLETSSGMNLADFFNQWVYAPGFCHFSIDSTTITPIGSNYSVKLYVKQKLTGAPAYYNNVPLLVTFKSSTWKDYTQVITASGQHSTFTITVPFNPAFVGLNLDEKVSEAIAPDTLVINKIGTTDLTNSRLNITVSSLTDSVFLYVEHNYTAPDPLKDTALHYRISPNRYWKISGIFPAGFSAKATLYYDGRKNTTVNGAYYLDTSLTVKTRDSLILLYRKNAGQDWREFCAYKRTDLGPSTDMYGYFTLDSLPQGEYVFANGVSHVLGIDEQKNNPSFLKVYPNPTSNSFTIGFSTATQEQYIDINDINGKCIQHIKLNQGQKTINIDTTHWQNGIYFISLRNTKKQLATTKVVVTH